MSSMLFKKSVALLAGASLLFTPSLIFGESATPDASAITTVLNDFHKALAAGAPERVLALFTPDVLIVEAGVAETRDEYEAQHLAEDIAFAQAVPGDPREVVVRQDGNVAWVTSTFRVTGIFRGKAIDNLAAETAILTRTSGGWRISTLHWSSHRAGPGERGEVPKFSPTTREKPAPLRP